MKIQKMILLVAIIVNFSFCGKDPNLILIEGAASGKIKLIDKALKNGANVNYKYYSEDIKGRISQNGYSAAFYAVRNKHPECLKYLISQGDFSFLDESKYGIDLFEVAINNNDVDSCRILIENGFNVNKHYDKIHGITPLHSAIIKNDYKIVKLLIENGSNIYAQTNEGFEVTIKTNDNMSKEVFCHMGITPLEMAKALGYKNIVELLN